MTITFTTVNTESPGLFNRLLWGAFWVAALAFLVALGRRFASTNA
jgi:hypothetical protein